MSAARIIVAILGLAVLMVVHECGHYFAARRFGMRVTRFSIGFGPTLWKHTPAGSPTTFQIGIIPFLAYVQIAGMNPYEEIDPKDKGSYANASLWGRIVTIAAGPLMNYLFASVLIFAGLMIGGKDVPDEGSLRVEVVADGPAARADIRNNDKIVAVNGAAITSWDGLRSAVSAHPGETIKVTLERNGERLERAVTPGAKGEPGEGTIQVRQSRHTVPVGVGEALKQAVIEPPMVVYLNVEAIGKVIRGKEPLRVQGPVNIVKETAATVDRPGELLHFLGWLSAYLGAFNLLPIPALDGGRLLFLGLEAASRRRADAKTEAKVHAVGLLMLLSLIAVITFKEVFPRGDQKPAPASSGSAEVRSDKPPVGSATPPELDAGAK